jgi:NDP-sugar pyrophosphorylase family protein
MTNEIEQLWVLVPVGGRATRLLPLTAEVSKACLRLLNRPLIEIALLCLARQGIKNFIFGVQGYTNYRDLHDYFESGVGFSARYNIKPRIHIKYQPNVVDYGSGDSARINLEYYDITERLFAVQGDNIFDIDLEEFMAFHTSKGGILTIGLRKVPDVTGFGVAEVDENMRISRFVEKPKKEEAASHLVNTGVYMFSREIRDILKEEGIERILTETKRLDFGYDVIPYLIETGRSVYGFVLKGSWHDVGTPARYLNAMNAILNGKLRSLQDFVGRVSPHERIWIQGESAESLKRLALVVEKFRKGEIRLKGSVLIGRHCQIEDGTTIADSCIDNYCMIGKDVTIENSAVMDRAIIGEGATIRNSIVGRQVTVNSTFKKPTVIDHFSTIADDVILAPGCHIIEGKVYPHLSLPEGRFERMTIKSIVVNESA